MASSLRSFYVENEVLNASPERLVQILYELGIRSLASARECVTLKDVPGRVRHINKVFAVFAELQSGIDFEAGADVAHNYARIYDYCQRRVLEANQKQSVQIMAEVEGILGDLHESWQAVVTHMSKERQRAFYPAENATNVEELHECVSCIG